MGAWVGILVTVTGVALSVGYKLGESAPETIILDRRETRVEVRDDYFRKCIAESFQGRTDGSVEETWACPKKKIFLLRKPTRYQTQEFRKGSR